VEFQSQLEPLGPKRRANKLARRETLAPRQCQAHGTQSGTGTGTSAGLLLWFAIIAKVQ